MQTDIIKLDILNYLDDIKNKIQKDEYDNDTLLDLYRDTEHYTRLFEYNTSSTHTQKSFYKTYMNYLILGWYINELVQPNNSTTVFHDKKS
jgi:hypothetical protein